ncbi:MAG: CPBP family intramembrane metalloprotease [Candidatus Symbiothrix sp.]|jgi:membrane protease YdiL (CAAX protease family)|nr:CPBP family intramembrane metalloprotease [Candidatus Symbiothrix sp.]
MKFLERTFETQNQFWKYLVVVLGGFLGGQFLGAIPLSIVVAVHTFRNGGIAAGLDPSNPTDLSAFGLSSNAGLALMLLPFVFSLILIVFLIRQLHRRSFADTVNGGRKIRFKRIAMGAYVWGILLGLYLVIDYMMFPETYHFQLDWTTFIPLIFIALLLIPIQTTTEELIFRGYLSQGVGVLTNNRWLALIVPGVLFALMHCMNPEVREFGFWISMTQYLFFGLLFGAIAIFDDGIELTLGMHAVNNVFLSLFVTHDASALQTNAVFQATAINPNKEAIVLILSGVLAFAFFARYYTWNFRLPTKIKTPFSEP